MLNIIKRPPCIECKHLTYDIPEYTRLRLIGDTRTHIKISCKKNILRAKKHTLNFLLEPVTLHTDEEFFAPHVESCPHFAPST